MEKIRENIHVLDNINELLEDILDSESIMRALSEDDRITLERAAMFTSEIILTYMREKKDSVIIELEVTNKW